MVRLWYDWYHCLHKALLSHRLWSLLVPTIYFVRGPSPTDYIEWVGEPGYMKPYLNLLSPQEDKEVRAPSLAPRTTSLEGILLLRGNEEPQLWQDGRKPHLCPGGDIDTSFDDWELSQQELLLISTQQMVTDAIFRSPGTTTTMPWPSGQMQPLDSHGLMPSWPNSEKR